MKTINVTFDDKEFEYIDEVKTNMGVRNWRQFILEILGYEREGAKWE